MKKGICVNCGKEVLVYEDTEHCYGCDIIRQDVEQGFDDIINDIFTEKERFDDIYSLDQDF